MSDNIINEADDEISLIEEEPKDFEEFLEFAEENPNSIAHSVKYILEAIESCGTRTVVERGEEKERYRFFDDPYGDGEHAVLGNTDMLNEFVSELRRMVSEDGENDTIIWFQGPTATGKSELKRCLVNGVHGYSKTKEGARYTLEWSLDSLDRGSAVGMTYGDGEREPSDWYRSPVNINPISVLPDETKEQFLGRVNEDEEYPVSVETDIDPFSEEAFGYLKDQYSDSDNMFSDITGSKHLRVIRYFARIGDGIGVLHSEDDGSPKERLVGSWMPDMLQEYASRGRKNPQAFSYDGVLSQGNSLLTVVEDASQHMDLLQKLLNVPEERMVKLDKKISMDIDTVLMVISNPDLEAQLSQYEDQGQKDPLKALRRRLDKHQFSYITSLSLETLLIHRLLKGSNEIWEEVGEEAMEKIRQPLEIYDCEFSPHAIETAAMYAVITRLDPKIEDVDIVEKAIAFEKGYHEYDNGERVDVDDLNIESIHDGEEGVPVTYVVDVLVDLAQDNDTVMPTDVSEEFSKEIEKNPLFHAGESSTYRRRKIDVDNYSFLRTEEDVLEAMLHDKEVTEEEVSEYVDDVFAWEEEDTDEGDGFDAYELREFESMYFGADREEGYTNNAIPKSDVKKFRKDKIISPLNNYMWSNRDEGFTVDDVPLTECPAIDSILNRDDWDSVERAYPNADFGKWRFPPRDSETEELKEKTTDYMTEELGYSDESAEIASIRVVSMKSSRSNKFEMQEVEDDGA